MKLTVWRLRKKVHWGTGEVCVCLCVCIRCIYIFYLRSVSNLKLLTKPWFWVFVNQNAGAHIAEHVFNYLEFEYEAREEFRLYNKWWWWCFAIRLWQTWHVCSVWDSTDFYKSICKIKKKEFSTSIWILCTAHKPNWLLNDLVSQSKMTLTSWTFDSRMSLLYNNNWQVTSSVTLLCVAHFMISMVEGANLHLASPSDSEHFSAVVQSELYTRECTILFSFNICKINLDNIRAAPGPLPFNL